MVPTGENLFRIAAFLDVDAKWLIEGESAEKSIFPKDQGIGETAQPVSVESLRDHEGEYRLSNALTLEERVARLEAAMQAIVDALEKF